MKKNSIYYVRNSNGIIQGFDKTHFKKLPKKMEREFKLKRILNISVSEKVKEIIPYDVTKSKIYVNWSGKYPNLCSGLWTIKIDNMELPIPEIIKSDSMGTRGTYSIQHFEETEYYYEDDADCWKQEDNWLRYAIQCLEEGYSIKFVGDRDLYSEIYSKISECDWRSGSCGGCI